MPSNTNALGNDEADVRFEGVEKKFDSATALHHLDLEIPRGKLFSLLGPSGCGKTTTLRLIAGFEQPTHGSVYIRGKNVTGIPAYKRSFGMVFQSFALFPHLTVAENIAFGLRMRRIEKQVIARKVDAVLELVELAQFKERYPRQLSGGQQQRVALARAVVFEPDVLLLDEPLSALDKMLREQMQTEIRQLQQRLNMTTVFVTHDQEEALTMSDHVAVMKDGRIQQAGPPRNIYEQPRTTFVATFLGASNLLPATVMETVGDETEIEISGFKTRVARMNAAAGEKMTFALRPEKVAFNPESEITARVTSVVYRGAQTFVDLDLRGTPLSVTLQNSTTRLSNFENGMLVGLSWDRDSLVGLEADA